MNHPMSFDELDQAIDRLLAGAHDDETSSSVSQLLEVAPDLRHLPRADFKARLMVELDWHASGRALSALGTSPSRAGNHTADLDLLPTLSGKVGGLYPVRGTNVMASIALHAAMLLFVGMGLVMVKTTARMAEQTVAGATMIDTYLPPAGLRPNHGGGGGGSADKLGASKGAVPRVAQEQFAPPAVVLQDQHPRLAVEATVIAPPDLNLPKTQTGDPLSNLLALSSGTGVSGVGSGSGDGVGPGHGPGRGPGSGGNTGGGVYSPGNGVTMPRAIYSPEPEFSEGARRIKHQGVVVLLAVIGPDGRPRNLRVARSLGMGLDEKAIDAVRTWRFDPGRKDGRPVAVEIAVEVDFHIL